MTVIAHPIFDVPQDTSGTYSAQLVDQDGTAIANTVLDSLTLTLYDTKSEDIINGRDGQDVLNLNDVTLDCSGNLIWSWTPLDMPRIYSTRQPELHTALWRAVWNGGASQILHEISFRVHKINIPS